MAARMKIDEARAYLQDRGGLASEQRGGTLIVWDGDEVVAHIPIERITKPNEQTVASLTVDAVARHERCSASI